MCWEDNNFLRVSPDNISLNYLAQRIKNPNYRGEESSQHNRYDMEQACTILKLLDQYAPNKAKLSIRTTDISKRSDVREDEVDYTTFCEDCKRTSGIGTPDAMRKNLFPDFDRMGLINRYDSEIKMIDSYNKHGKRKYVSLTDMGLKFIQSKLADKHFIFSKGINELLRGRIDVLLNLFEVPEWEIKKINIYEYMFFVSAIGSCEDFGLVETDAVNMLKSYRGLSNTSRDAVIDRLKQDLKPDKNKPKPERRDFHNWKNKIQQIFYLINQTNYFTVIGDDVRPIGIVDSENKLRRSLTAKHQYFKEHNIKKENGFELHHVVPLSSSESKNEFKMLDTWKNMIYIDGFNHSKITQKRTKNVIMKFVEDDLKLLDHYNNTIFLRNADNVKYAVKHKQTLLDYNIKLLEM